MVSFPTQECGFALQRSIYDVSVTPPALECNPNYGGSGSLGGGGGTRSEQVPGAHHSSSRGQRRSSSNRISEKKSEKIEFLLWAALLTFAKESALRLCGAHLFILLKKVGFLFLGFTRTYNNFCQFFNFKFSTYSYVLPI